MRSTRLIIVRHGNTFLPGEAPRRVGGRTDLPLVPSGVAQAKTLGLYLKAIGISPRVIFAGPLKRTRETAALIHASGGFDEAVIEIKDGLRELDYGPDENQNESAVEARLGKAALTAWEEKGIVPSGWQVEVDTLLDMWKALGQKALKDYAGQDLLVVTSNGVARFAAALVGGLTSLSEAYGLKLATGAYGIFEAKDAGVWQVQVWNKRPV